MNYKNKKMKVAFLGLGIMGSRMAANLLKNNVDLTVFNRSETPLKELETKGAKIPVVSFQRLTMPM